MNPDIPNYCPVCGAEATGSGRYCSECGSDMLGASDRAPEEPPADEIQQQPADDTDDYLTRRQILIGGSAILLGGGALVGFDQLSAPPHRVYDGWDMEKSESLLAATAEGSLDLPSGRYAAWTANPTRAVEYEVDFNVTKGDPIDVFVTDDDEYDRYRTRERSFQTLANATSTMGDTLTASVGPGEYRIVIDNTGFVGATSGGDVDVDVTIVARPA